MTDEYQIDGTTIGEKDGSGNLVIKNIDEATIDKLAAALNANGNNITDSGTTVYDASTDTVGDGSTSANHQSVSTADQTISNSVTYPDGTTITTSPSSGGSQTQPWDGVNSYNVGPDADYGAWEKSADNPVFGTGTSGSWDDTIVSNPELLKIGDTYYLLYGGNDGSASQIGLATSTDLVNWTREGTNPVLTPGGSGDWDESDVDAPSIVRVGDTYYMLYRGTNSGGTNQIGLATSTDLVNWTKEGTNPVLSPSGSDWDGSTLKSPSVIRTGSGFMVAFGGNSPSNDDTIGIAYSDDLITYQREPTNPVLRLSSSGFDDNGISHPTLSLVGDTYHIIYTGNDGSNDRLGHAYSASGANWTKSDDNPVISLGSSGSWDDSKLTRPSLLSDGNKYRVMYAGNGNDNLGFATLDVAAPEGI